MLRQWTCRRINWIDKISLLLMLLSRVVTIEICQLLVVSCQRGPFSQSLVSQRVQELTSSLSRRLMTSDEVWRRIGPGNTRDLTPDEDNQSEASDVRRWPMRSRN